MNIIGKQFINGQRVAQSKVAFSSSDASTGAALPYTFFEATGEEVQQAVAAATVAFMQFRQTGIEERAVFLETIAGELDELDNDFIGVVMQESGLPEARIRGERQRTSNQLRLFAQVLRRGDFLGVRIDTALPERQPLSRPDIRQYRIALGPVAVFGASNFPLAFSVAGGDTASALAAGCPVVVKAHPGHPATSELVAGALVRALRRCNLPAGVFGMLFGNMIGADLVKASGIKAVAFTGSLRAGQALCELAAQRPEPIPVFAEMSGINPVILLPKALEQRGELIAAGLAASATLGSGQFCTKPGLVIGFKGEYFDRFRDHLAAAIGEKEPAVMLNRGILNNYDDGMDRLYRLPGIKCLSGGTHNENRALPTVFLADSSLLHHRDHPLENEVFGPVTVLVAVSDQQELIELLPELHGHLTSSLFAEQCELSDCLPLIEALETRVGRIIFNDYPTGVEVCDAMVHGGPYPATSDNRTTSVGSLAMDRFLRPVCYQGYPDSLLPAPLKNANPHGILRLVNGKWTDKAI
ncbi:MAG: ketoglutarate semialdehyde dehydrogenase [Geobacteraceae bacterium GWC2_55_20]|nr:MAG: ketoglutarate semialdehyde dehydrogenase [Geobacteraceae bacterium GWC2_55_20]OGU22825.1 MAG: ketoglutarate semialdehyde dehydrogenase [Geobacteraceae bacterium GWF2_54_21]HBA71995.1 aldehyde dehydrogenase (NADP(+)) [Geobacter sp.]HCE67722.1 aldehyde dehydrogenase (NADP(+)) [Geobacter sp.]